MVFIGSLLGFINIGLIIAMFSIYPIKHLYLKTKNKKVLNTNKFLRKIHPILAIIVIFTTILHAYLKLGGFYFHNGLYIFIIILCMGLVRFLGLKVPYFKKRWLSIHRFLVIPLFLAIIYHVFM